MAESASAQRSGSQGADSWFRKDGGSPADRIPVFRESLADVARAWSDIFASLTSTAGEITLDDVQVCKVDEILARRTTTSVLAVLQAPGWNTAIGLYFDRVFIATMVEALFGGGEDGVESGEATPLSPVDLRIAEVIAKQMAEALEKGFAKRLASTFRLERVQVKLDPAFLGKPVAPALVGTLKFAALGTKVFLDVLAPLGAMMVFADELAEVPDTDHAYTDARWTQRLETEVGRAFMSLTAHIDLDPMTLRAVTSLQEGQLIELPQGAGGRVRLVCGEDDLFRCELGQSAGFYTLRIEEATGSLDQETPNP